MSHICWLQMLIRLICGAASPPISLSFWKCMWSCIIGNFKLYWNGIRLMVYGSRQNLGWLIFESNNRILTCQNSRNFMNFTCYSINKTVHISLLSSYNLYPVVWICAVLFWHVVLIREKKNREVFLLKVLWLKRIWICLFIYCNLISDMILFKLSIQWCELFSIN